MHGKFSFPFRVADPHLDASVLAYVQSCFEEAHIGVLGRAQIEQARLVSILGNTIKQEIFQVLSCELVIMTLSLLNLASVSDLLQRKMRGKEGLSRLFNYQ